MGDCAWLLSVPRSSSRRLRAGQEPAVLAVSVGVGLFGQFYCFCSLHLSPEDGSIKTEILPQSTGKPKQLINSLLSASASTLAYAFFV